MTKWLMTRGTWFLAIALLVATMFLLLVKDETYAFPSVTNTRPSGYAAFFELLERDGYQVYLERSAKPNFSKAQMVIAPRYTTSMDYEYQQYDEYGEDESAFSEESIPPPDPLDEFMHGGGTVFEIEVSDDIKVGRDAEVTMTSRPKETLTVTTDRMFLGESQIYPDALYYTPWMIDTSAYVGVAKDEKGRLVLISDGLPFTNRNLDQRDNARFALNIVRAFAPKGARIAFYEHGIGNSETPSVTNALGSWAVVARWQALAFAVLMILALGRRFGPPTKEIRAVRGSRELYDAVADVLRRRGDTATALRNVMQESQERLAKAMPSVRARSAEQLIASAPKEVREQYRLVMRMTESSISPSTAATAARRLLRLVADVERDSRAARGLGR